MLSWLTLNVHLCSVTACTAVGPHDERMLQQADCPPRLWAHRMPEVGREQDPWR